MKKATRPRSPASMACRCDAEDPAKQVYKKVLLTLMEYDGILHHYLLVFPTNFHEDGPTICDDHALNQQGSQQLLTSKGTKTSDCPDCLCGFDTRCILSALFTAMCDVWLPEGSRLSFTRGSEAC